MDSLLYLSCLYHHHWISINGLTALFELPLPLCRPSYQWTHSAQTNVNSITMLAQCHWINISGINILAITGSASVDSLLPLPCQPLLDQRQWISISGLNSAKANNSINILAITGSVPVDSPLPQPCRPLLDLASVDSQLYSSCLYHHVGHHWISVSGLTALLELPLPPCRPSLDQRQWTHCSTRAASTTMSAITGSVSVDSLLPAITGSASVDSPLYSSCLYHHHWISISGLTLLKLITLSTFWPSLDRQWTHRCLYHVGHY